MFQSARLTLTAWYLVILMVISIFFSGAIYRIVTTQIEGIIHRQNERIQRFQNSKQNDAPLQPDADHDRPPMISTEELQEQEKQLLLELIIINGVILVLAGGAAYFLAGRTLNPIKEMIDEQNQFISSSSHELRTPLATMRAEMEGSLLENHISDKHARELITSNLDELHSLQQLTNNLLNLAQIHNGYHLQFKQEVVVGELLDAAIKKVLPLAKKKHITIKKDIIDAELLGEKASLIEAFVILLENAIKYSSENTTISIATYQQRRTIKVSVTDQGIGIAPEDIPHIFDRFYRADKSRQQEGFGLGLSIAKKTVDMHGGTIQVKSELKKGTTFTILLPLHS